MSIAATSMGISSAVAARMGSGTSHAGSAVPSHAHAMAALGDLSDWDPATGAPAPQLNSVAVAKLIKKNKVRLGGDGATQGWGRQVI